MLARTSRIDEALDSAAEVVSSRPGRGWMVAEEEKGRKYVSADGKQPEPPIAECISSEMARTARLISVPCCLTPIDAWVGGGSGRLLFRRPIASLQKFATVGDFLRRPDSALAGSRPRD
jgi:hypothetical protein